MSQKGIEFFAGLLTQLQLGRGTLLKMGTTNKKIQAGNQDIMLANLCDKMNDAIKHDFCEITMIKTEEKTCKKK